MRWSRTACLSVDSFFGANTAVADDTWWERSDRARLGEDEDEDEDESAVEGED